MITFNQALLQDALGAMRATLNKETHNTESARWGLLEKAPRPSWCCAHYVQVSVEIPCTCLAGGRFIDAPGCASLDTMRMKYLRSSLDQASSVLLVLTGKSLSSDVKEVLGKSTFLTRLLNREPQHRLIAVVPADKEQYKDKERYLSDPDFWYQTEVELCENKEREVTSMLKRAAAVVCALPDAQEREQYARAQVEPFMENATHGCKDPDDSDAEAMYENSMGAVVVMPVYPCWEKDQLATPERSNCNLLQECIQEVMGDAMKEVLGSTGVRAVNNVLQPFLQHVRQLLQLTRRKGDDHQLAQVIQICQTII